MEFIPKTTIASNMPTVSDGSLIATTDTGELYIDAGSNRVKLSDIVTGTETSIRAITAPITSKLYFATDTHKLLQASYDGSMVTWTVLNNGGSSSVTVDNVTVTNTNGTLSVANSQNCTVKGTGSIALGQHNTDLGDYSVAFGVYNRNKLDGVVCNNNDKSNQGRYRNRYGNCGFKGIKAYGTYSCLLFPLSLTDSLIATVDIVDNAYGYHAIKKIVVSNCYLVRNYTEFAVYDTSYCFNVELLNGKLYLRSNNGLLDCQIGIFYTLYSNVGPGSSSSSSSSSGG